MVIATLLACAERPRMLRAPVFVQQRHMGLTRGALEKVAVAPLYAGQRVTGELEPNSELDQGAGHVQHFLAQVLQQRGVDVVASNDVAISFSDRDGSPYEHPLDLAKIVARDFNATAVLVGKLTRYRDVETGGVGPPRSASVAFVLSLYSAPDGRKLWTGRYDETQVTMTDNPQRARYYPGRGSRRLSALDLARFGVEKAVEGMMENP
jgi:hypothetical protein